MEPRLARQRIRELEDAIPLLRLSRDVLHRLQMSDGQLIRDVDQLTDELNYLRQQVQLPVWLRERPRLYQRPEGQKIPHYHVFIDECGTRDPKPQTAFPLFVIAAVVVESSYYDNNLCPAIEELKKKYWPDRNHVVFHEPDMRQRKGKFAFNGDWQKHEMFYQDYASLLRAAEYIAISTVIDKALLLKKYARGVDDPYLPRGIYSIAYDHLLESICYALYYECDNAIGALYPESVQLKNDAELQLEHARIFLRGTRRVAGSWFQYQIRSGLRFFRKGEAPGNEVADTVARTIADHALGQGDQATLWNEVSPKLYCGDTLPAHGGWYKRYPHQEKENAPDNSAPGAPFGAQPKLD